MSGSLLTERSFAEIVAAHGGRVFRVGGCVRDMFMGVPVKQIDLCVVGMVRKNFKAVFPDAEEYSKSFLVFRLPIDGVICQVAFARTERKVGSGYKGFKVLANPKVTIEEDLCRRDLTVNAIAVDSLTGEIIDPCKGVQDIKDRILRATSAHFSDDPIRVLRLAGQFARLGFNIDNDTLTLASTVADELAAEPVERIFAELVKVLREAGEPSRFFKILAAMNLLATTFVEISELNVAAFNLAMVNLDAVARLTTKPKLRFAAMGLVLDNHQLACWNKRMTLPADWLAAAMAAGKVTTLLEIPSPELIVAAIYCLSRGSLQVEEFDIIAKGIGANLPSLAALKTNMHKAQDDAAPKLLKGKELGEWLRHKHIEAVTELLAKFGDDF